VVHELAKVGEARRDRRVVARRRRRIGVLHRLGQREELVVARVERLERRKHAPELAGIAVPAQGTK
jgi:hypothetical protein